MSIRRMMLFTLGGFFKSIISLFKTRVLSSQGEFEAETCLNNTLEDMGVDLFDQASLVVTPNGYKENVLFSVTPSPVGTNLLLRSEEFENSTWIKTLTAVSSTFSTAPNSLLEARTLQTAVDASSGRHRLTQSLNSFISINATYTFSIYAKKNQHRWIQLNFVTGFDLNNWANFDLENGVIGNKGTGAIATIEDVGGGWYRLSVVGVPVAGQPNYTAEVIVINNTDSGRYPSYQSTVAENVFDIWGAQLEYGSTAGNYIPTVTRQAINETICDLTVTRNTTATRVNPNGLIEDVPYNLISYSQEFENAYWFKTNGVITVTQNITTAPDGTFTADQIKSTLTNGELRTASITPANNGQQYTWSVYVKSAGSRYCTLTAWSNDDPITVFDLTNISIISESGPAHTSTITDVGNSWRRITITRTIASSSIWFRIFPNNNLQPNTEGVYLWGVQIVPGTQPKDYFPTTNRLNVPRIDYSNGSCPSLLVEPQRTNLLPQSADFTNGWTQEGISITGNTQISPDGLLNADSIFELATNDVHRTYRSTPITVTANSIYTTSFFVKKNNIRYVRLILTQNNSTTIWAGAQFDLDTQTFTSQVGTDGGIFANATITSFTNGWYRISVSGSIPGTSMFPMLALSNGSTMLNTNTRGCPIYLGNTSNSLFVWGAQLELGSNATSYISTTTATVTRNADVISNPNAFNLIGQTEGTILIKGYQLNRGTIFRLRNNASITLNRISIFCADTNGRVEIGVTKNNATISNASNIPLNNTTNKNILIIYSDNIFKFFINGILFYSYTYPSPTNFSSILDTLEFGSLTENGTATFNSLCIWKTQLTDAQAIQLTTL